MGAGIAKSIREFYPEAYDADRKTIKGDDNKLGLISWAHVRNPKDPIRLIINCYGQFEYAPAKRQGNYEAIYESLERAKDRLLLISAHPYTLGIPYKFASDRAGCDWRVVEAMILSVFEDYAGGVLICKLPEIDDGFKSKYFSDLQPPRCNRCNGTGRIPAFPKATICDECNGTGTK